MNTISQKNTTDSPQIPHIPIWASLKVTVPIALLILY